MFNHQVAAQPASQLVNIPAMQFDMPAAFSTDGSRMISLREVAEMADPTALFAEMSSEQWSELVVRRIEMQPKFEIAMIGAGLIDKDRAIAEVKSQSEVGCKLIEIEQRLLKRLVGQIQKTRQDGQINQN